VWEKSLDVGVGKAFGVLDWCWISDWISVWISVWSLEFGLDVLDKRFGVWRLDSKQ
jgi:hypothetical protein